MQLKGKPIGCLIFFLLLVGCSPKQYDNSEAILLQTDGITLIITPASIPVETPLRLKLKSSLDIQAVSAEIRGLSMYMGRLPLHWRKRSDTETVFWEAEFLLGACTDPSMRWQLQLTLTMPDNTVQLLQTDFISSW